jgi:phage/plasmid-like protein (TIGR03299 family)
MPAEVEQMFSVREMPWHRQGTVLDGYPQDFGTARKLAGLDWEVEEAPALYEVMGEDEFRQHAARVMFATTMGAGNQMNEMWKLHQAALAQDGGFRRLRRSDTGATLSYQAESYTIIQNAEFGEIMERVRDVAPDQIKWETGGCLAGGRKVWMLAYLDEPIVLPGDATTTLPYLALTSRHDGSGSCALRATAVRIVCGNTFSAAEAEGERTGATFSFVHKGDWHDRVEDARAAVTGARREIAEYTAWANDMLTIAITPVQERIFIREFLPAPPKGLATERVQRNVAASQDRLQTILAGPTVEGAGIRYTAYGLAQAAGEYLDHVRAYRSWETRLNRTLLTHESGKTKAAKLAREVALA